jgi:hypothetical protein
MELRVGTRWSENVNRSRYRPQELIQRVLPCNTILATEDGDLEGTWWAGDFGRDVHDAVVPNLELGNGSS